jgi:hypothetical protein
LRALGFLLCRVLLSAANKRTYLLTIRIRIRLHEVLQRRIALGDEARTPKLILLLPGDIAESNHAVGPDSAPNRIMVLGSQQLRDQPLLPTPSPKLQPLTKSDRLS